MDLNKAIASTTEAINELNGDINAALGSAKTELVAALRILKAQSVKPAEPAAPTVATAKSASPKA